MGLKLANNAVSTLAGAIAIGATALSVQAADAGKFPALAAGDWFPLTIVDAAGNLEIVRVTARNGATLTVTRAQEGTTAKAFAAGARCDVRLTQASIAAMFSETMTTGDINAGRLYAQYEIFVKNPGKGNTNYWHTVQGVNRSLNNYDPNAQSINWHLYDTAGTWVRNMLFEQTTGRFFVGGYLDISSYGQFGGNLTVNGGALGINSPGGTPYIFMRRAAVDRVVIGHDNSVFFANLNNASGAFVRGFRFRESDGLCDVDGNFQGWNMISTAGRFLGGDGNGWTIISPDKSSAGGIVALRPYNQNDDRYQLVVSVGNLTFAGVPVARGDWGTYNMHINGNAASVGGVGIGGIAQFSGSQTRDELNFPVGQELDVYIRNWGGQRRMVTGIWLYTGDVLRYTCNEGKGVQLAGTWIFNGAGGDNHGKFQRVY